MEEILASVRRIIAEDDSEKSAPHPAEAAGVELNPDAAASSLGAARAMGDSYSPPLPDSPAPSIGALSGTARAARPSTVLDLIEPMASSASQSAAPASIDHAVANEAMSGTQSSGAHDDGRGGLMSNATSAAVDSAFNALAQTVLVHNARTLEDLVREMLRPMLKVWLDDNLPGLVERLVRAEIERVSRGRGS
jgi:uncharacterized protein